MADSGSIDKDELRKLSPEMRIKRLRELEEKRKKELEETDRLIRESFDELEERQAPDEPPEEEEPAPGILEERSELEEQLMSAEMPRAGEAQENIEYAINLYDELAGMAQETSGQGDGYMSMARAAEIYDRIMEAERYQGQSETVKNIAEGSRRLMRELFGDYKADHEYRPEQ